MTATKSLLALAAALAFALAAEAQYCPPPAQSAFNPALAAPPPIDPCAAALAQLNIRLAQLEAGLAQQQPAFGVGAPLPAYSSSFAAQSSYSLRQGGFAGAVPNVVPQVDPYAGIQTLPGIPPGAVFVRNLGGYGYYRHLNGGFFRTPFLGGGAYVGGAYGGGVNVGVGIGVGGFRRGFFRPGFRSGFRRGFGGVGVNIGVGGFNGFGGVGGFGVGGFGGVNVGVGNFAGPVVPLGAGAVIRQRQVIRRGLFGRVRSVSNTTFIR